MTEADFHNWLTRYGAAWEQRDPIAAAALFSRDAQYFWTPFAAKRGPGEIEAAWRDGKADRSWLLAP